jgi:hypothetical protein
MDKRYVGPVPGRTLYICSTEEYGKGDHCCIDFNLHANEKERIALYIPEFREHNIRVSESILQEMFFCPWCGKKFPESLREKFFDTLESDYNISTDIGEYKTRPDIPSEFQSDEWWKKRGL